MKAIAGGIGGTRHSPGPEPGVSLVIAALDPAFVKAAALDGQAHGLTWPGFLIDNLLPVTLGNIVGGSVLVAAVYWFVYLRGRQTAEPGGLREDQRRS